MSIKSSYHTKSKSDYSQITINEKIGNNNEGNNIEEGEIDFKNNLDVKDKDEKDNDIHTICSVSNKNEKVSNFLGKRCLLHI